MDERDSGERSEMEEEVEPEFLEHPNMEHRKKRKRSEVEQEFFVYTSETKYADITKETLIQLRVSSSVKELPVEAFCGCTALVHVHLPEALSRIGRLAFARCSELKYVEFFSKGSLGATSIDPNLEDGKIVFPERATPQIEDYAFSGCNSLRKVIVCSNSTKLGKGAFCECRGLVSVELPEGLQVIEEGLFYGCESLRGIAIPSSLTKIGVDAFNECHGLASVELPNGLLELGMYSFYKCYSLETLHVPATVSSIGTFAFSGCMGLKHIKLPPTLKRIESYMFYQCLELEYIDIPSTVSFIGDYAFCDCSSLSHIRIPPDVDQIDFHSFLGCSSLISLEVPEGILIFIGEDEEDSDEEDSDEEEEHEGVIDLVNLALPTLPEDDEGMSGWLHSKLLELGSVVRNGADVSRKLKHRFDHSPLNKLCYYQSYHSSEDIMLQLRSLMEDDPLAATCQVDEFGMTPLHVLSLSQTPNIDMLLTVLNGGHLDHVIRRRDSFGSTPMDYLCLNQMPESAEVIRRVLQTRFDHMLSLDRSWKSDVVEAVNEALAVDPFSRMRVVIAVYLKLANYERKEVISVLELYLWKTKIDEVGSKEEMCDREGCRINSGASIVIPHVLPFLGKLDMEEYFVCSQD